MGMRIYLIPSFYFSPRTGGTDDVDDAYRVDVDGYVYGIDYVQWNSCGGVKIALRLREAVV